MMVNNRFTTKGLNAAILSALFLGLAPVFGKQSISLGLSSEVIVALRTSLAAILLLIVIGFYQPRHLYIYPAGLVGCLLAGSINGIGSIFYYNALERIDVGIGQLLYALYPFFLVLWMVLLKSTPNKLTLFRLILATVAVYLLIRPIGERIDWVGVSEMLIASALYALHIPINQKVLYDMPAPTVTLYTLIAMSVIVIPVSLYTGVDFTAFSLDNVKPLIGLTVVTFLSRLTLFIGIKHLGGVQTAIIGLGELLIAVFFAYIWLGEQLTSTQWLGAGLLGISLLLVRLDILPVSGQVRLAS
jgi:drug/metabolite transporter (DMT)-like permease